MGDPTRTLARPLSPAEIAGLPRIAFDGEWTYDCVSFRVTASECGVACPRRGEQIRVQRVLCANHRDAEDPTIVADFYGSRTFAAKHGQLCAAAPRLLATVDELAREVEQLRAAFAAARADG